MLRKLKTFLKSYRAAGGASPLVVFVLLLCASMLSLTMLFSGSSNISDILLSSIPLEFAFKRIHYFEQYYDPYTNNGLSKPKEFEKAIGIQIRLPYIALQEDNAAPREAFPHHMTHIAKEEQFLEHFLSGLDELAQDPAVKYASYNLQISLAMRNCAPEGYEAGYAIKEGNTYVNNAGTYKIAGINGMDFFAHNNISLIEAEEDRFSDDAAYVSDHMRIRGEDGKMRPIEIGDRIEVESAYGKIHYKTYTVKGIFHRTQKFDYSYGADGTYLGSEVVAMYVSNASLRQIHPLEFTGVPAIGQLPFVHAIVFDIKSPADYDGFYQKLNDFSEEMDAYTEEIGLWGTADLRVQTPTYLKMAGTVTQTVNYYSLVMLVIDMMLLILSGGLILYLLLGKRREMYLLYSLGMSKIRIAGRYLAYFLLPVLLTTLIGIIPGLLLDRFLCTQIANDIFSAENALLSFSSSGNQIMTSAQESIRSFFVNGTDIAQALGFTILVTVAITGGVVLLGTLVQLRGNIRSNERSRE